MIAFWKFTKIPILLACVSFFLYWLFAYDLIRTEYTKLITLYSGLWIVFLFLLKYANNHIQFLTVVAFLSRVIFIFAIPNLSQDFYRFIWDGRMILEGFNPYLYTPESFMESGGPFPINQAQELYTGMGELNGSHFTNYPPLNQFCFILAALVSNQHILGAVITLKLIIIAADFGTFFFGKRLLKHLNLPVKQLFWYLLNPFIIIELTGNLHFEGVMIFFLIWSAYLLHLNKWKWAGVVFALSVSVKLIPLLFLPLLLFYFVSTSKSMKQALTKSIGFYSIVGLTTLLLFAPFFSLEFINNYTQTIALWFNNFEFNASIYYLAREIGYWFTGYNQIAIIGKISPLFVVLFVIGLTFFRRKITTEKLIVHMLFAFSIYLFLSTTVHPWYIATLLILSVFTRYKFPLVWSYFVILSYVSYSAIGTSDKSENLYIIALEYSIVFSIFVYEVFLKNRFKT